jgi:hypothetical protein
MPRYTVSQTQGDFPGAAPAPATPPPAPAPAPTAAPPAMPDLGMPPMPDMGMGMGMPSPSMPTAPASAPGGGERQEIIGPITSPTQIFYDMDIANYIENNIQLSVDDLTRKIWLDYGGKEDGKRDNRKLGKRTDDNLKSSPEEAQEERDNTEDSKWERLESGDSIEDIISYSDLGKMVSGLMYGVTMKITTQSAAPQGGGGMGMPMAANKARIIIAKKLEKEYLFRQSDTIINEIINKINLS